MTGDPTRDNKPDSHHWGGPDEPIEDEYAQHQREQREAEQRERMDAAHEAAKADKERCGRRIPGYYDGYVDAMCGRPDGHDGHCGRPLAEDKESGDA